MMQCSLLSLGCVFGFAPPENQIQLSALRALKIAQRRLRPEVRSKLLSVSSPRTNGTLVPDAWRFVFFDAGTSGSSRMVTVAAKTSSEHPDTVEAFSAAPVEAAAGLQVVPQHKWLIDSDKVLEKIRAESKMKGVKSVQYRLTQPKNGQEPYWTLQFFSEKDEPGGPVSRGRPDGDVRYARSARHGCRACIARDGKSVGPLPLISGGSFTQGCVL